MTADARDDDPAARPEIRGNAVWRFRGYDMRPAEFNAAMTHFYRGEIQRSTTWRIRLDTTTNWAVVTTGAGISFALADPGHHHSVIVLNLLLVTLFLWIEARRYRYYELWTYRVRLLETDYLAAMLVPPFAPRPGWAEDLAASLLTPRFPISMWEAVGRRFRRNYMWLVAVLDIAWAIKSLVHPTPTVIWSDFVDRFGIPPLSGHVMLVIAAAYNAILLGVGFATAGLTEATGEILPNSARVLGRLWRRGSS
jgi:uncharacterized membrane protein